MRIMDDGQRFEMYLHPLGFFSTTPSPSEEILSHHYAANYYQNPKGTYAISYSEQESLHRKLRYEVRLYAALSSLRKSTIAENIKAIDIGCGEGYFLDLLMQKGFECLGLDYSPDAISKHNPQLLDKFLPGDPYVALESCISREETFDVVIAGNVLEHVVDVSRFLTTIRSIMHPGSVAIISVPNDSSSYQRFLLDSGVIDRNYYFAPPEHLNYFNKDSLQNTLSHFDFEVTDLFADFPIEWFLANEASNYVAEPKIGPFAHQARITIETLINSMSNKDLVLDFWRGMAEVGMGRVLTAVCKMR